MVAGPREGMTGQLWLVWCAPWEAGEAGSRSAPTGERHLGTLEVRTDGVAAREPDSAFLAHPVLHALEEVFGLLPELGVVPVERPGFVRGVM